MMAYSYLVLYTDGTIGIYASLQNPEMHQVEARFFECKNSLTIEEISEALYHKFDESELPRRITRKFQEMYT